MTQKNAGGPGWITGKKELHMTGIPPTADSRNSLQFHPLADIFPPMEGAEFDALVADIKANGLRESITIYEGKILDGRNRARACQAVGWAASTILSTLNARHFLPEFEGDPAAYVISANIHRRHLTAEQKGELIAKLIKAQPEKSNRQVAKATGVSHPHVAKVRAEMEQAGDVETVTTSIDTRGRKQPAKRGWSRARWRQHRAKRTGIRHAQEAARRGLRGRREDDLEFLEAEAKHLAAKLIALDCDLAGELHLLLCQGGDLDLADALNDGLGHAFSGDLKQAADATTADVGPNDDGLDIPASLRRAAP
jgi:hypothetical protein